MRELLWYTRYGAEGASSRYRAFQYMDAFEGAGYSTRFEPLAPWQARPPEAIRGVAARLRSVGRSLPEGSIVAVQKEPIMPPTLWPLVRRPLQRARPMLWDVDDAIWIGSRGAGRMATEMATISTVVVAGNDLIADWMERQGATETLVVPTCFDPLGPVPDPVDHDRIELVWVGSPATAERLRSQLPSLSAALRSRRIALTCVGAPPFAITAHHEVKFLPWTPENEHAALSAADFGLAFLPRDEYSDHKCGLKIIQYLAYGVIPVATRSPVHEAIAGPIGLLVDSDRVNKSLTERLMVPPTPAERRAAREKVERAILSRCRDEDVARIVRRL